jgi:hypothetical protein
VATHALARRRSSILRTTSSFRLYTKYVLRTVTNGCCSRHMRCNINNLERYYRSDPEFDAVCSAAALVASITITRADP